MCFFKFLDLNNISLKLKPWKFLVPVVLIIAFLSVWVVTERVWNQSISMMSLAFTLIGVWITLKVFELGNKFNEKLEDSVEVIQKVSLTAFKNIYLENLRFLRENSQEGSLEREYWNFIWRFETFDILGLSIYSQDHKEKLVEFIQIRILGTNQNIYEFGLDEKENTVYTAQVISEEESLIFKKDEIVYCTFSSGSYTISNQADNTGRVGPENIYTFSIVILGDFRAYITRHIEPPSLRVKDLNPIHIANIL